MAAWQTLSLELWHRMESSISWWGTRGSSNTWAWQGAQYQRRPLQRGLVRSTQVSKCDRKTRVRRKDLFSLEELLCKASIPQTSAVIHLIILERFSTFSIIKQCSEIFPKCVWLLAPLIPLTWVSQNCFYQGLHFFSPFLSQFCCCWNDGPFNSPSVAHPSRLYPCS